MGKLDTIYIISKGRPQCTTAQTLTKIKYPSDWYIVCGNNDETLDEYKERWGDKVLVFDWYEEIKHTDTLDNFGFDAMPSGAVPVRNATQRISRERGELRHWQFDDDYTHFYHTTPGEKHKHRMGGKELRDTLQEIAEYAHKCGLQNAGIALGTIESHPAKRKTFSHRVFNAHCLPNDPELFTVWRGRLNDDLINAIETYRNGGYEMLFKYANLTMPPTQQEDGSLSDIYRSEGTVRKTAYPVLIAPNAVKLVGRFGRYHHRVDWQKLVPKVLHENYQKP